MPLSLGAIKGDEPVWLRKHLIQRLDEMCGHWKNKRFYGYDPNKPEAEQIEAIANRIAWLSSGPFNAHSLVKGLQRFPEGQSWLNDNQLILKAIRQHLETEKSALKNDSSRAMAHPNMADEINQGLKILEELGVPYVPPA